MNQKLSIETEQINEGYRLDEGYQLGERYNLGALQGEYYVAYTSADIRRYRFLISFMIVMVTLYIFFFSFYFFLNFNTGNGHHIIFPFYLLNCLNPFIIFCATSSRCKWGNRPLIGPRNRHLRVYLYQGGLVKQTDRRSDVVRWSELYKIDYEPLQPGNLKNSRATSTKRAGIKLKLHGGRQIAISGALHNLDDLAHQLYNRVPQFH